MEQVDYPDKVSLISPRGTSLFGFKTVIIPLDISLARLKLMESDVNAVQSRLGALLIDLKHFFQEG